MPAFLPGSQIDVRPVKNLDSLKGKEIECRVIKLNRKRGNIVLSRKSVIESETARRKAFTLEVLREDAEVRGTVKNITDYGVFIDLGGIDGLLHVTDLSWGRVSHPSELFKVGDEITVMVTEIDNLGRINLSRRAVLEGMTPEDLEEPGEIPSPLTRRSSMISQVRPQQRPPMRQGGGGDGGGFRGGGGGGRRRGGGRSGGGNNGGRPRPPQNR